MRALIALCALLSAFSTLTTVPQAFAWPDPPSLPTPPTPPTPPNPNPPRLPTEEELWGEAGAKAYPTGAGIMTARHSSHAAVSLDERSKRFLRPHFGDLVDRVRVVWNATPIEKWEAFGKTILLSGVEAYGQTYCERIYIQDTPLMNHTGQLLTLAHELAHAKQCQDLGGFQKFGYHYFYEYRKVGMNYRNNKLEVEAYDFQDRFKDEYEAYLKTLQDAHFGRPCTRKIALKTLSGGKYVTAEQGGGTFVSATSGSKNSWTDFRLVDLNCGNLALGNRVNLVAPNGMYVVAENANGPVNANREAAGAWEEFTLGSNTRTVRHGSIVTLKTRSGKYWVAEGGGGARVNANRDAVGDWEKFVIEFLN